MSNGLGPHTLWVMNAAIASSYIVFHFIRRLFLHKKFSQAQQLKFARKIFIITPMLFFLAPYFARGWSWQQNQAFQFQPLFQHVSEKIFHSHVSLDASTNVLPFASGILSLSTLVLWVYGAGICLFFLMYINDIFILRKLTRQAFCQRKINDVHILFSDNISIPFCWSSFSSHFVLIPDILLEKNADLKLAIRHELQHLRQSDTHWLHLLAVVKWICFWNPFM